VRALVENGALAGERGAYRLARTVSAVDVPASVHVVLTARIDRLLPMEKRLLQAASGDRQGRLLPLLQAVVGMSEQEIHGGLARLRAGDFLYEVRLLPELEYTFKHALTRDVAYQSYCWKMAADLAVGEWGRAIEKVLRDHRRRVLRSARNSFRAGRKIGTGSECYLKAAEKAQVQYAFGAATRFCERALEMMKEADVRVDEKGAGTGRARRPLQPSWITFERANSSYEEGIGRLADPPVGGRSPTNGHRPQDVVAPRGEDRVL